MKDSPTYLNDFIIDRLTNSITNKVSGDSFATEVSLLSIADLNQIEKNGWLFNWKEELKYNDREVYKLTIVNNLSIVQGMISLTIKSDHVAIHLIENAKFNKEKPSYMKELQEI